MKKVLKTFIEKIVSFGIKLLRKSAIGRFALETIIHELMNHVRTVVHNREKLLFSAPNDLNRFRAETFSIKEPETLSWIDQFQEGTTFWDIGANVGLYSIYAGKTKNVRVFSFEPSVFNLELLARNIYLNQLVDRITIVPLPLSDRLSVNTLRMTSMDWGGALSSFGQEFGHDGKTLNKVFDYSVVGLSMEEVVDHLNLPLPDYIKMDVDGIEHLILSGGKNVLKKAKEILLELNEDFSEQFNKSREILTKAGFRLKEKRKSEISNTGAFENTFNQIWINSKSAKIS